MTDNKKLKGINTVDNGFATHVEPADANVAVHTMHRDVKTSIPQLKGTGMKAQTAKDEVKTDVPKVLYDSKAVTQPSQKDADVNAHTTAGHGKTGDHLTTPDAKIPSHSTRSELKK
jgi:hypothetical protein